MTLATVLRAIEEAFPVVARRPDEELMEHKTGCTLCDCERQWILERSQPYPTELSDDAVRGISLELSCYSAAGLQWVMPSLARAALKNSGGDDLVAERWVISLANSQSGSENRRRLRWLTRQQIAALVALFNFKFDQTDRSYRTDIAKAISLLRTLKS